MFKSRVSLVAAFATLALAAPAAQASAQALPGPVAGLTCANATFSISFSKCWTASGNDHGGPPATSIQKGIATFLDGAESAGATWSFDAKSDDLDNGAFGANVTTDVGTINFSPSLTGWFALTFKQANDGYALYTFNVGNSALSSLNYNVSGVGFTGNGISHSSLFDGKDAPACDTPGGVPCEPNIVPEPTSFALMFGGLLGLGVAARRRRNS